MTPTEIFEAKWPGIKAAMTREMAAWDAYSKVGIGKITKEMVEERMAASRAFDDLKDGLIREAYFYGG